MSSAQPSGTLSAAFPSEAWLASLRTRGFAPAFADARAALDARVDAYHAVLPDLPDRQAGYYHEFFCPDHAVQLVYNPRDGHHHACPVDGRVFSGEPFDSAWGWSVNDALSDAALRVAVRRLLGHAPGQADVDAGLVRRVLLGYAARYRTMPPAPQGHPSSYSGMVCWSALDESVWIIRLVWAAALAREAFSAGETSLLREGLFQPALDQLTAVRYQQIQNVGNWDRGAILNLALLLGDEAAVERALDEEYGIRDQLTRGVTADGLWWELSLSYHFYVLGAVSWTMRALRASGRAFDREDVIRGMFAAPLDLAYPDLSLPATNDCWYHIGLLGEVGHGIPNADGFYEMAFGWFGDPSFAWVVNENRRAGRPRATFEGLLDGALDLPMLKRGEPQSRHFAASGLAMLRAGSGPDAAAVLLKASANDGDAHGHPDQLGLAMFAGGARVSIDPGTPGYGIGLNDTWYRQTASHSTVLIDSLSQPPGEARITRFESTSDRTVVEAEISWPDTAAWPTVVERANTIWWPDRDPSSTYAGVRIRRRLELRAGELIDTVTVDAPGERLIDLVLQLPPGIGPVDASAALGTQDRLVAGAGYEHLTEVRALRKEMTTFRVPLANAVLSIRIPGDQADHARFLAAVPGNPAADRHSVLIRRRTAETATFVTTLSWHPSAGPWRSSSSSSG